MNPANKISNKAIVTLLSIVLVVTIVGTIASISRLHDPQYLVEGITGANIMGLASIGAQQQKVTFIDNQISLGTGRVTSKTRSADIFLDDNDEIYTANWQAATDDLDITMSIANQHEYPVRLSIYTNDFKSASNFFCQGDCKSSDSLLDLRILDPQQSLCEGKARTRYDPLSALLTASAAHEIILCERFLPTGDQPLQFVLGLTIPPDASLGNKELSLKIKAEPIIK